MNNNSDELIERTRDLARTGVAKAKELTDVVVSKAKELAEIGKLKVQNATEQENIKKAYLELGKLYYAERGAAPEPAYAAQCEKIAAAQAKIEYNNERVADMKAVSGLTDEEIQDVTLPEEDITETEQPAAPEAPPADSEEDKPQE